jgi:hypothetical protein
LGKDQNIHHDQAVTAMEQEMTPFVFGILLHYYCCADDHPAVTSNVEAWRAERDRLIGDGWLEFVKFGSSYRATEKTKVFIDAALATPEPVQMWVIPKSATEPSNA